MYCITTGAYEPPLAAHACAPEHQHQHQHTCNTSSAAEGSGLVVHENVSYLRKFHNMKISKSMVLRSHIYNQVEPFKLNVFFFFFFGGGARGCFCPILRLTYHSPSPEFGTSRQTPEISAGCRPNNFSTEVVVSDSSSYS